MIGLFCYSAILFVLISCGSQQHDSVGSLDYELASHNLNVITPPNSPGEGIRVAIKEHDGAPVALIEFKI
jgi:hypothetical protein